MPDETVMTAAELAERLQVKPETILGWHRTGRIPARRLTRKVLRFNLDDVMAALETPAMPGGRSVDR